MQFPLLGLARDFHPLDNAHAERTTRESVKPVMGITLSLVVYPATISTNLLMTSSRIMMTSSNLLMTSSGSCLLIRALVTFDT